MKIEDKGIIFDPVDIPFDKLGHINLIAITHEHVDHFDKRLAIGLNKLMGARILTTPFIADQLMEISPSVISMKPGDCFELSPYIRIFTEYSKHNANMALTFFIQSESATIFHPNDSEFFPEMEILRVKYRPKIMTFLGNSFKNLNKIINAIRPEIVITYDYPHLKSIYLSETKVVVLKKNQWFHYPDLHIEE
jgi:L-ascorbate metabolism protein UlaG (beta-lactamase superfamily)